MARYRSRRRPLIVVTLSMLAHMVLSGAAPQVATAATGVSPDCGETLGPGGDFFLRSDVGPCSGTSPALIVDSARLDMRGHIVKGDDSPSADDGIHLIGTGSVLENGTVRDANEGVEVAGTGSHIVRRVTSKSNDGGFAVFSANNILRANTARGNADTGFYLDVGPNSLTGNTATGNFNGFETNDSVLASGNRLWNNAASNNDGGGYRDESGGTAYTGNRATANGAGFLLFGDGSLLLKNTARRSQNAGFQIDSNNNTLGGNKAIENRDGGFVIPEPGAGNDMVANRGKDNRGEQADLADLNGDCLSNRWEGNKGRRRSPDCTGAPNASDPAPSEVTPNCGDTLPPGDYILTANVGPCSTVNSLILDSARLDMNGRTVSGDGAGNGGIHMIGTGSALRNGVVKDGSNGVQVSDVGGRHIVSGVISKNNEFSGFDIDSPANIVRNSSATGNGADGFKVFGSSGNLLTGNSAALNDNGGFSLGTTTDSALWNNIATSNDDGFFMNDASGGDALVGNRVLKNSGSGFDLRGTSNLLLTNVATKNGAGGPGFGIDGNDNVLGSNKAIENKTDGIAVAGLGNSLVVNRGRDNRDVDLRDTNTGCGTNRWEGNKGTRDPATCIG